MRMRNLLAALMLMAACGRSEPAKQTTVEIERVNALGLQVVDHDSEYMRRVFVHVGSDARDRATDPMARIAGITAHQDVWQSEATPHRAGHDYYLEASDRGPITGRARLEAYFKQLATDRSFHVPSSHELGFEQYEAGRWRSYYLHRPVVIDGSEIESAHASVFDDRPVVVAELSPMGGQVFGDVTREVAGGKLAILSDGEVVSAPIINGEIAGGMFSITMGPEDGEAAAERLAKKLDRD